MGLVIADCVLPQFSAHSALEILQASGFDLPFIIVSGTIGEDAAVCVMKAGAHDYRLKDNLKRFVPGIQRELRKSRLRTKRVAAWLKSGGAMP
jgi:DNA-binding NtrC family response regulator